MPVAVGVVERAATPGLPLKALPQRRHTHPTHTTPHTAPNTQHPAPSTPHTSQHTTHSTQHTTHNTHHTPQDAPYHFLPDGGGIDTLPLASLVGPAYVIEVSGDTNVTGDVLAAAPPPADARRLLFKTQNSRRGLMGATAFASDYVGLDSSAARLGFCMCAFSVCRFEHSCAKQQLELAALTPAQCSAGVTHATCKGLPHRTPAQAAVRLSRQVHSLLITITITITRAGGWRLSGRT